MPYREVMDDDIANFRFFAGVVRKNLIIILIILLIFLLGAVLINFIVTPEYESTAEISLGNYSPSNYVARALFPAELLKSASRFSDPSYVKTLIESDGFLKDAASGMNSGIVYEDLKRSVKVFHLKTRGKYLQITFRDKNPQRAKTMADMVVAEFSRQSSKEYTRIADIIDQNIETNNLLLKSIEQELLNRDNNLATKERAMIGSQRLYLGERSLALQAEKSSISSFKIEKSPQEPEKPVSPNKRSNVVTGAVIGLVTGLFVAFSKDYLEKRRSRSKASC